MCALQRSVLVHSDDAQHTVELLNSAPEPKVSARIRRPSNATADADADAKPRASVNSGPVANASASRDGHGGQDAGHDAGHDPDPLPTNASAPAPASAVRARKDEREALEARYDCAIKMLHESLATGLYTQIAQGMAMLVSGKMDTVVRMFDVATKARWSVYNVSPDGSMAPLDLTDALTAEIAQSIGRRGGKKRRVFTKGDTMYMKISTPVTVGGKGKGSTAKPPGVRIQYIFSLCGVETGPAASVLGEYVHRYASIAESALVHNSKSRADVSWRVGVRGCTWVGECVCVCVCVLCVCRVVGG